MSENALLAIIVCTPFVHWLVANAIDAWERVNTTYCCDCDEEEGEVKDENITL